jgi:hypothetical protein
MGKINVCVHVCDGKFQSFITGHFGFYTSNTAKEYMSKMGMPVKLTCYSQHKN